jgi:hypothetical protein
MPPLTRATQVRLLLLLQLLQLLQCCNAAMLQC